MTTKFDIYDFITNTEVIHLLVDYQYPMVSSAPVVSDSAQTWFIVYNYY